MTNEISSSELKELANSPVANGAEWCAANNGDEISLLDLPIVLAELRRTHPRWGTATFALFVSDPVYDLESRYDDGASKAILGQSSVLY